MLSPLNVLQIILGYASEGDASSYSFDPNTNQIIEEAHMEVQMKPEGISTNYYDKSGAIYYSEFSQ